MKFLSVLLEFYSTNLYMTTFLYENKKRNEPNHFFECSKTWFGLI